MSNFEKNAEYVKQAKLEYDKTNGDTSLSRDFAKQSIEKAGKLTKDILIDDLQQLHKKLNAMRKGEYSINDGKDKLEPTFIGLNEAVRSMYGFADAKEFVEKGLGISMQRTAQDFMSSNDFSPNLRYLIPEIFLQEVNLGLQRPTIHESLIAGTEYITQPVAFVPVHKPSDTPIRVMAEGDTSDFGSFEFDVKSVRTKTIGGAFRISDKAMREVPMALYGKYIQDFANSLNRKIDAYALSVLMNGNAVGETAPNIGVETASSLTYKDLARIWNRGDMINRRYDTLVCTEDMALRGHLLPEFFGMDGDMTKGNFNFMSNVPTEFTPKKHALIPANKLLMVDKQNAMIKLIRENLFVETDRIVNGRFNDTYISMSMGFAKMFRDAAIFLDTTTAFSSAGFPSYMDYTALDTEGFEGGLG